MSAGAAPEGDLAKYLAVLSVPNRLELLRLLQVPMTARQIQMPASRASRDLGADRTLTRGAVEAHLKVLQEVGFVHARWREEDGREVLEYATNHAKLFTVVDELRRVMLQRLVSPLETGGLSLEDLAPIQLPRAPALVVVNGPHEGHVYALEGAGPWTLGRDVGAHARIQHDPFVSREHATIVRVANGFAIREHEAKNGTRVNWRTLTAGEDVPLVGGDLVGIGRTLLVFRRGAI